MNKSSVKRWIIVLLCAHAVLIAAIVARHTGLPQAYGQVRPYDYVLVPGKLREDRQNVWIIDMGTGQLTTCIFNDKTNVIEVGNVIEMFPLGNFR